MLCMSSARKNNNEMGMKHDCRRSTTHFVRSPMESGRYSMANESERSSYKQKRKETTCNLETRMTSGDEMHLATLWY